MGARHTLLTAADHRFARTLWQMLASAERQGLPGAHRIVAIDLGLAPNDRVGLERRFPWCVVRPFVFDRFPAHVADLSNFAWKPIVVADALDSTDGADGLVLWFDSATLFHGPLAPMLDAITRSGVFTLTGQTPLGLCCDPRTLELLGATADDRREPYRAGGVLGFDPSRTVVRELVERWRRCALDPACIAPAGLDPRVHRFDQAVLTFLLCDARRRHGLAIGSDEIDISSRHPVRWVSTRNKVPNWVPHAMDVVVRAYYAAWKGADRAVLAIKARR